MDVITKSASHQEDLYKFLNQPAANQSAEEQLDDLLTRSEILTIKLLEFKHENHKRPSVDHKQTRADLKLVDKEIKKTQRAIKKCKALKAAASHIGKPHGNITLNKTRYQW